LSAFKAFNTPWRLEKEKEMCRKWQLGQPSGVLRFANENYKKKTRLSLMHSTNAKQ